MTELHHTITGRLAGAVAVLAYLPYLRSILAGRTRPSKTSWLLWTLLGGASLSGHLTVGGFSSAWLPGVHTLAPALVLGVALGQEAPKPSSLERFCLLGSLVGMVVWFFSRSAAVALIVFLAMDGLATLPTLHKARIDPRSEDRLGWSLAFGAALLNLGAVSDWSGFQPLDPVYFALSSGAITVSLWQSGVPAVRSEHP